MNTYHILYQTTNKINGKIYIGVHSTNNLDDGYMGSGKLIRRAFDKHGKENFTREIIEFYDTKEEAYAAEKTIVTRDFISETTNYNIAEGGFGGWTGVDHSGEKNPFFGKKHSVESTAKRRAWTLAYNQTESNRESARRLGWANRGRKYSAEVNAKKHPKDTCEVCGKTMNRANFVRYNHGPNCDAQKSTE